MSDTVIRVENLCKQYRLGTINHGSLQKDLQSFWARLRGREDPNSLIGSGKTSDNSQDKDVFLALDHVSFEVRRGESVAIVGRNGAGKSTLLKILSRIICPDFGRVRIRGRVSSLLEVGTGFHPDLSGRDNIYLSGAILGMKRKEIAASFDEIVAFSEVERFIDTPIKRYSSGMRVRLAFSIAAHMLAEIVILDEVLAVGDKFFQEKCTAIMSKMLHEQGRTLLFVSHSMPHVQKLCQRGLLLEQGCLIQDAPIEDIVKSYAKVQQGLDSAAVQVVPLDKAGAPSDGTSSGKSGGERKKTA